MSEIEVQLATAVSAAHNGDGLVELLVIGERGQPTAYRFGPGLAVTLILLLREAVAEIGQSQSQVSPDAIAGAPRGPVQT